MQSKKLILFNLFWQEHKTNFFQFQSSNVYEKVRIIVPEISDITERFKKIVKRLLYGTRHIVLILQKGQK